MKNLKHLILVFIGLFAMTMSFTSCLNSSDDNQALTPDVQKSYLQTIQMNGPFMGRIRFFYPKNDSYSTQINFQKYDSLDASWDTYANDSSFVVEGFPVYKLDSAVVVAKDATGDEAEKYRSLNTEIRNLRDSEDGNKRFYAKSYILGSSYIDKGYYYCTFMPQVIETKIKFNGGDHKVYFVFGDKYSSLQSASAFNTVSKQMQAQTTLYAICIDKLELSQQYMVPSTYMKNVVISFAK